MAKLNIDFSKVEASLGKMPALPTGWQRMTVEESEHKPSSNNATTGNEIIAIKLKVMDGPYAGAMLFKTFNYKNQSQQAQDIGWGEMKALNDALGIAQPEDTGEWHNKPLLVHVKYKPARTVPGQNGQPDKDYDEGNDINGFKNINDTTVEVNHNVKAASGGSSVTVSGGFANGGSPVPAVGKVATSGLSAAMAAVAPAAAPATTPAPAAPSAPVAPAAPAAPVAPVVKPEPVFELRMTAKANGMTKQQFVDTDPAWTDEVLIANGYAEMVEVTPTAPNVPSAPTAPAAPAAPATTPTAAAGGKAPPPWEKK